MSDRYETGMGVGYMSDKRTQFRHPDLPNFMIFQENEAHISQKNTTSNLSHECDIEIPYFSLIPYDFKFISKSRHIICKDNAIYNINKCS